MSLSPGVVKRDFVSLTRECTNTVAATFGQTLRATKPAGFDVTESCLEAASIR